MSDRLPHEKGFHVSWDQMHRDSRAQVDPRRHRHHVPSRFLERPNRQTILDTQSREISSCEMTRGTRRVENPTRLMSERAISVAGS